MVHFFGNPQGHKVFHPFQSEDACYLNCLWICQNLCVSVIHNQQAGLLIYVYFYLNTNSPTVVSPIGHFFSWRTLFSEDFVCGDRCWGLCYQFGQSNYVWTSQGRNCKEEFLSFRSVVYDQCTCQVAIPVPIFWPTTWFVTINLHTLYGKECDS